MSDKKHRNPTPTIDAIIHNDKNQILLIKRKNEPFMNHLSLPGGFVNNGEKVEDALKREIKEEVSLNIEPLEILGVYSDPSRDPRDHIMSIVFICLIIDDVKEKAGDDAAEIFWINLDKLNTFDLAFDHKIILEDYLKWRNHNSTYWSSKIR
jgi:8-oxo-dGTP diphosphatase